jgi:spore germination protein YaaH
MLKLRTLHALAALCATFSLSAALMPANVAASAPARGTHTPPANAPARSAPRAQVAAAANGHLQREVFGFALGNSSLADSTYGYASWSFDLLSTVAYFGLDINWDGTIIQGGAAWTTWNSTTLTNLVAIAHAHGTRVLLSINLQDFNGSPVSTMCAALHPLHRKVTVAQTVAQVQKMHVDGVNFDYEGLNATCAYGPTTRVEMTSLAAEMRAALPSAYIAVDTYAGAAADPYNFFDVRGLAPSVDTFFVMAYDMEYSNQNHAPLSCPGSQNLRCLGPTSPLSSYYYNDTTVMSQYVSAVGSGKVILGVPYYGRKACVASATRNALPTSYVVADDYLSASGEATDPSVLAGSYATHRDAYDGVERWDTWYNTSLRCTRELYWDDAYSLGRKYDLVESDGLRGVGIFALQYGGGAAELWNLLAAHFVAWTATYDLSQAPTSWQPGQTRTFNVTVTNTSAVPWPASGAGYTALDLHFTATPGGSALISHWLTSQVFRLPADVSAGQSVVIPVTVTAPATAGTFWLEAEMFRNHLFWFSSYQSVATRVARVLWFATYDLSQAPTSWRGGERRSFSVTVKNTGNQAWPSGGSNPVELDVNFAPRPYGSAAIPTWLSSSIFPLATGVAPGQSASVMVTVTAPSTAGSYYLEAQLFKNQRFWFDSWQPVVVHVVPAWSASYNISGVPAAWSAGQLQSFTLFVTNTGAQTWPASGANYVALDVHFSTAPGGSAAMSGWLTSQVFRLSSDTAPGKTAQVAVHVTAPRQAGALYLEAELFKNQQFWFASFQPVAVAVGSLPWSAGYDVSGVPSTWSAGQTQWFTVLVKNTGTATWPATGLNHVALDMHFTTRPGGSAVKGQWLTSQVFNLSSNTAPGQTAQIAVKITAPAQAGPLYVEAEMFKNQQFWFPLAEPVSASVAPATWWASSDLSGLPPAWSGGQTQVFTVFVANTGNELWPATGPNAVELDLHFTTRPGGSAVESSWMTSQVFALRSDTGPGGIAQIAVSVTAPRQAGAYYLEAEMFKNQQFWIQPWQPVAVTVG